MRPPGRFEAADTGTLFLDEVGDMPPAMQVKLLRALETRIVERVGGMLPIAVDVRLIAATSVDLFAAIDRGRFRADLLYRLDVVRIEMPPLADRPEDVPLLVDHFCGRLTGAPVRFDAQAMATLAGQPWPGNVRELKNLVDRAQAHFPRPDHRPQRARPAAAPGGYRARSAPTRFCPDGPPSPSGSDPGAAPSVGAGIDLKRLLADMESAYITESAATPRAAPSPRRQSCSACRRTTLIEKMRRLQIGTA